MLERLEHGWWEAAGVIDLSLESPEANRLEPSGPGARSSRRLQRLGQSTLSRSSRLQYHRLVCRLEGEPRSSIFPAQNFHCSQDTICSKSQTPSLNLSLFETQELNRRKKNPLGEGSHQKMHPVPF